jgi:sugar phosphate isomerase/epimerase
MVLPDNYWEEPAFQQNLKILQDYNFYGVELNIADPGKIDIIDLQDFLQNFNLKMTMFASGLTAKTFDLSLSTEDENVRKKSIIKCKEIIDFVAGTNIGVIIGFLKGTVAANVYQAEKLFKQSLTEISSYVSEKKVNLLLEATNRNETSIANTLQQAVEFIKDFNNPFLQILPDTYHINIEKDDWKILEKYQNYYKSLHISDDNRYFPGLGSIQFENVIELLKSIGYQGGIAIEGNIRDSFAADIQASMDYLIPIIS